VVEVPAKAGQEAAQPKEQQPQQDQPAKPAVEVESGAGAPPPVVPVVAPVNEALAPPQGSAPAMVDLTLDDSPVDKGKQVVGIEGVKAVDQAGPSATPESDLAEASAAWPDLAGLALVRAEDELLRWGRSALKFRDASNPSAEPIFMLDDKDEVHHWEYLEGLRQHTMRSLRVASDALAWGMSDAFEVSRIW
jgi:hypothetical protein